MQRLAPGISVLCLMALGCEATLSKEGSGREGEESRQRPDYDLPLNTETRVELDATCAETQDSVGVTKLRRLTRLEYNNSVQSLFGVPYADYSSELPVDEPMGPFFSNQTLTVGPHEVRNYAAAAELVADAVLADGLGFLGCPAPTGLETECISDYIGRLATRAYRRPLEPGESEQLLAIYELGRSGPDGSSVSVEAGVRLLLRAVVGAPNFLYIVDTGTSGTPSEQEEPASQHTLATRLSFALWNSLPDDELVALADAGTLADPEIYSSQVDRMIADPRTEQAVVQFFQQWTGVNELPEKEKDLDLFPEFTPELVAAMLTEQAAFVREKVFVEDAPFSALFEDSPSAIPPELASVYAPSESGAGGERPGLLTQAAYLAAHHSYAQTSPVHLGMHIRESLLCDSIPPPPPDVDTSFPEISGEVVTTRDRLLAHQEGSCAGCHQYIDPPGFAFEHYDAIGRFRETDNGVPIDASGTIVSMKGGEDWPEFNNALDLSDQFATQTEVRDCFATQVFRSALDRFETESDSCSALGLLQSFEASGGNVRALLSSVVHSHAFKNILLEFPEASL